MKQYARFCLVLVILLSMNPRISGAPRGDDRVDAQSVLNVERAWVRAFLTGDTDYLDRLLEPDYESVTYTGQVRSKQQILDKARAHREHPLPMPELKDPIIQIHGSAAISRVDQEVVDPSTGQKLSVRLLDVLVFYDGRWHVLYTEDVPLSKP